MKEGLNAEPLEPLIFTLRGHRVVLDADLARLYGVTTTRFNEAFQRNRRRFPSDFVFQVTPEEVSNLRSQIAISSSQGLDSSRNNCSQVVTSSHGGRRYLPWAFTEHGALMAANILRSPRAVQMSVFVARLAEIDRKLLQHDVALLDLYQKLEPLLQPPADPPKRRIGFHSDDDR